MAEIALVESAFCATAFGLVWHSDLALEHFTPVKPGGAAVDVIVRRVAVLRERTILKQINRGALCDDGFRFTWEDQAAIDVFGGDRVEVSPLARWNGALPWAFYSTVAALLLASRGKVPFHAGGIAINGRAVLICGPSGAGKSTLTAGLVQHGAQFIADDLTIIDPGEGLAMLPGRPTVRLLSAVARILGPTSSTPVRDDPRGKLAAAFSPDLAAAASPLGAIVVLDDTPLPEALAVRFAVLRRQLFRPTWLAALPGQIERQAAIRTMVSTVPMLILPPLGWLDPATFGPRCEQSLAAIRAVLR